MIHNTTFAGLSVVALSNRTHKAFQKGLHADTEHIIRPDYIVWILGREPAHNP